MQTARIAADVQPVTFCHIRSGCLVPGNQAHGKSQEMLAPLNKGLPKTNRQYFLLLHLRMHGALVMG